MGWKIISKLSAFFDGTHMINKCIFILFLHHFRCKVYIGGLIDIFRWNMWYKSLTKDSTSTSFHGKRRWGSGWRVYTWVHTRLEDTGFLLRLPSRHCFHHILFLMLFISYLSHIITGSSRKCLDVLIKAVFLFLYESYEKKNYYFCAILTWLKY